MAARTVSNTGGNWNDTAAWVGGVVPIAGDTVDFTSTSGNLTVNVSTASLAGINFTNYVNTITFNNNINVNTSVNLGTSGYTQAGAIGLVINGTTTITSNGVIWSRTLSFSTGTQTLSDNLSVTGTVTFSSTVTMNSNTFNIGGNLTISSGAGGIISGTTNFVFNGSGTWTHSSSAQLRNNVTINTSGTLTLGTIYYNTGTLTYVASGGTVNAGSSTLNIGASTTLNTNGINWNNVTFSSSVATTITLTSDWNIIGTLTINNSSTLGFSTGGNLFNPTGSLITGASGGGTTTLPNNITITNYSFTHTGTHIFNSNTIFITGNITITSNGVIDGTTLITMSGTGTWSRTVGQLGRIVNNLTIDTLGTITISGTVTYGYLTGGKTLTYVNGTVNTSGSTLDIAGNTCTFNTSGMTWDNVSISAAIPNITLNSDFNVGGNFTTSSGGAGACTINGLFNINVSGNLLIASNGETTGTSTIRINGTGSQSWTHSSTQYLSNNLIIDKTSGVLTIGANVYYRTRTLTFVASGGTVNTTGSTLNIGGSCTLATNGITWVNINTSVTATITLTNNLVWSTNWISTAGTITFSGVGALAPVSTANIAFSGTAAVTIKNALSLTALTVTSSGTTTLTGDLTCTGLVTLGAGGVTTTLNSGGGTRTIIATNGITSPSTTSVVVCNVNIKVTGGTITSGANSATGGYYQVNTTYQFEIDGNVTFASTGAFYIYGGVVGGTGGTFKYTSGTVITTGSSIYLHSVYINSGSITWNNVWILSGGVTISVLQSNMVVNGLLTLGYLTVGYTINNDGTTRTITAAGGISLSGSTSVVSGTANITCTGGTITGISSVQLRLNLTLNGNITFASGVTFSYNTGTLTYTSGTITTTNSTLSVATSTTFATNGMIWNIINWSGGTITLTNALTATGLITASHQLPVLNGSDLYANGGMTFTGINNGGSFAYVSGTSTIRFEGTGAWTSTQQGTYRSNVLINPTGNFSINIYYAVGTITYSSTNGGTVTAATVILGYHTATSSIGLTRSTTFDTNTMRWDLVYVQNYTNTGTVTTTLTLISNLNVNSFLCTSIGNAANDILNFSMTEGVNLVNVGTFTQDCRFTINLSKDFTCKTLSFSTGVYGRLNNNTITVTDLLTSQATASNITWTGTAKIVLGNNCTWSRTSDTGPISFNMEFQGNLTLGSTAFPLMTFNASTLTYTGRKSAKVLGRLAIGTATMTNMHKVAFQSLTITSGATVTMNQFFGGSPDLKSTIGPSSTTNYTISFSDALEKIARYVNVTRSTISRAGQLSIITPYANGGNNIGIKFAPNQINNGISINLPANNNQLGFDAPGLVKDPLLSYN